MITVRLKDATKAGDPTVPGRYLALVRERNGHESYQVLEWFERGGWRQHPSRRITHYVLLEPRQTKRWDHDYVTWKKAS